MRHHKLVMPGHLNHYGYLFGGMLLQWVDELSWISASLDYPGCKFVTIGMDRVEFRKSVREGTILVFDVRRIQEGRSSVRYQVDVFREDMETGGEESIFSTQITFVCLDGAGGRAAAAAHRRGGGEGGAENR